MITANILNRTLFIRAEAYGSAFVIDVDGNEYIVTARHLLPVGSKLNSLMIRRKGAWIAHPVEEVGRARGEIDIAVLKTHTKLVVGYLPAPADSKGLALGQDVLFAGFPYKLEGQAGALQDGRPLSYVKKGTVSVLGSPQHPAIVLDALNNEGFSGGPVVFCPIGSQPTDIRIAAVVSKYRTESEPVVDCDGKPTGASVGYNTGFLYAFDIGHAVDLINRHRG